MLITCNGCKTSYDEQQFNDFCEPVDDYLYTIAEALLDRVFIDSRRCECCGQIVRLITSKLEDKNNDRTSESKT